MHLFNLHDMAPHSSEMRPTRAKPRRNALPPQLKLVFDEQSNMVDRLIKTRQLYIRLRGGVRGNDRRMYPRTTNADVMQLATLWSKERSKVKARGAHDRTDHRRWAACVAAVGRHADPKKPNAPYSKNEAFWQCSVQLAIYLESRKAVPSKWTLLKESLSETLQEIPGTLGNASHATAGAIADAGGAVANFVKKPINTALVVLGGAILLPPIIRAVRR